MYIVSAVTFINLVSCLFRELDFFGKKIALIGVIYILHL